MDNRIIVKVDAARFTKRAREFVAQGETLGRLAGMTVHAPFDGVIESVSRDGDNGIAVVSLVEVA